MFALHKLHQALAARPPLEVAADAIALQERYVVVVHVVHHIFERLWFAAVAAAGHARSAAASAAVCRTFDG